jgi:hypothetical protein
MSEPYPCSLTRWKVGQCSAIWMLSPFLDQIHYRARGGPVNCDFFLNRQIWYSAYGIADSLVEARSLALDPVGNVYIVGYANKSWGAPLHAYSGDYDVMIMKLNSREDYQWHTYTMAPAPLLPKTAMMKTWVSR